MSGERYVGERSALWHFLSELRPLVVDALGEDALLRQQRYLQEPGTVQYVRTGREPSRGWAFRYMRKWWESRQVR